MPNWTTPMKSGSSWSRTSRFSAGDDSETSAMVVTTFREIYAAKEVGEYRVAAKVLALEGSEWFYNACAKQNCGKKLTYVNGNYNCKKCGNISQRGCLKFKVTLRATDTGKGNASLLLWDRQCNDLLGLDATMLKEKYSETNAIPKELEECCGKAFIFVIQAKDEHFDKPDVAFGVNRIIKDKNIVDTFWDELQEDKESEERIAQAEDDFKAEMEANSILASQMEQDSQDCMLIETPTNKQSAKRHLMDEFSATKNKTIKIEKED